MNPEEAIKIIQDIEPAKLYYFLDNEKQALKLGIEAMKRLRTLRQDPRLSVAAPLPGETDDSKFSQNCRCFDTDLSQKGDLK